MKRRKEVKTKQSKKERGNEQNSVRSSVHEVFISIHHSQSMMEINMRSRAETEENCVKFEQEKFWIHQATLLISTDSGALEEDEN